MFQLPAPSTPCTSPFATMTDISATREPQKGMASTRAHMSRDDTNRSNSGGTLSKRTAQQTVPPSDPIALHVNKEAICSMLELVCSSNWRSVAPRMDDAMPWKEHRV